MKRFLYLLTGLFVFSSIAKANPACPVCTFAIAGSLTLAKIWGIDPNVVALWSGAMLAMLGYWAIRFCDKKGWTFPFYKQILMIISVSMIGFMYIKDLTYSPVVIWGFLYLDYFLFYALFGAFLLMFGVNFYAWMKAKNGGHAHFPFEKVVVPIALLVLANVWIVVFPPKLIRADLTPPQSQIVSVNDTPSFD